ncbi:MAG TPA: hypothetical protein VNG31_00390, partial [Candidatus Baltobacteraceae bacterium]|nr:hypothetical protein [Candidatus Baltobacteraceae bacterium]
RVHMLKSWLVISAKPDRRRNVLLWSLLLSMVLHAIVLSVLLNAIVRSIVPQGARETISQITITSIQRQPLNTPSPVLKHRETPRPAPAVPQTSVRRATRVQIRTPKLHATVPSAIAHDQINFAKEVAQLDKADDPHVIPTIDPASQESATKSYRFDVPASMRGEEHGNGIIVPTRSWHDGGQDCYYGRYEYTYPDGSEESGSIAWPFCYDPETDPFKEPPHPMAFPPPLAGYVLPPGTDLPPIERDFYRAWAASAGR